MQRILKKGSFKEAESRLACAFRSLLTISDTTTLGNEDVVAAVEMIEKRTGKKKITSVIKFKDSSADTENIFKDKLVQFKITCFGSLEEIRQIFISGEDQAFLECSTTNLLEALVDLISLYYVFHVSYPDCMVGILSFLQDIALECSDNIFKGTKYSTFMAELRNKLD